MTRLAKIALGLLLAFTPSASTHELPDNRATLVLRDRTHVSATFYIAYPEVLHQALVPQREFMAFLLIYSSMKPEDLRKELLRAQARLQATTHLFVTSEKGPDREVPLTNWIWPDLKQVQAILQQRVMGAIADPAGHTHEAPVEIHADANSPQEVASVRIQFPEEFQKVLVVAFRPSQLWVEGKALSPALKF